MDCKITKKMINAYITSQKITGETEEEVKIMKKAIEDNFFEQIKREIIEEEKKKIVLEAQREIDELENKKRVKEIKVLMYEGVIVAFIVGLIVNQATDLVNVIKGITTNVGVTIGVIILLAIVVFIVYHNKFSCDVLNYMRDKYNKKIEKKEENKNGCCI